MVKQSAGIADDDKQPMLTGVAAGAATVMALWVGWALVARWRPGLRYHPGHLVGWQWYSRLTMNVGGLLGGLVAIGIVHS